MSLLRLDSHFKWKYMNPNEKIDKNDTIVAFNHFQSLKMSCCAFIMCRFNVCRERIMNFTKWSWHCAQTMKRSPLCEGSQLSLTHLVLFSTNTRIRELSRTRLPRRSFPPENRDKKTLLCWFLCFTPSLEKTEACAQSAFAISSRMRIAEIYFRFLKKLPVFKIKYNSSQT